MVSTGIINISGSFGSVVLVMALGIADFTQQFFQPEACRAKNLALDFGFGSNNYDRLLIPGSVIKEVLSMPRVS